MDGRALRLIVTIAPSCRAAGGCGLSPASYWPACSSWPRSGKASSLSSGTREWSAKATEDSAESAPLVGPGGVEHVPRPPAVRRRPRSLPGLQYRLHQRSQRRCAVVQSAALRAAQRVAVAADRDRPRRRRRVYDDDRLLAAQRLAAYATGGAPLWGRQQALLLLAGFAAYFPNAMFQDMAIIPMASTILFFLAGVSEGVAYKMPSQQRGMPGIADPARRTHDGRGGSMGVMERPPCPLRGLRNRQPSGRECPALTWPGSSPPTRSSGSTRRILPGWTIRGPSGGLPCRCS